MKKRKIISIMAASALIFGGLTLSVVSCGDTEETVTNPKLVLSLESSSIYVGETTKVSVTSEGKEVTDCEFVLEGDGNKYVSVDDDGTVTGIAPGKATIKARKANYQAGTIEITVAAVPVVEPDAVLEFEKGSFYNANGSWSSGGTVVESPVESSEGSSGGQSIGYQSQGVSTTIEFTAKSAGTVDLGFVMASTAMDFMNNMTMSPMTVKDVITIKVNDTPLTLDGYKLPGSDQPMNFTNWSEFKVNDVSVKEGANTIIVTTIASQGPNMDCIKVYGDLGIEQTEAKQPEKVSLGTYTYFVNGYEWGPGVYKIVADLGEGNNVKAGDLSNDLFSVSAKGAQGGSRTVTDIYLVDENNEKAESLTEGTKIGFDLELNVTSQEFWGFIMTSYNGCNPFSYDMTTSKNSWAKDYTYEIRLNSNKTITVGDTTYNGKEAILTIDTPSSEEKVIPCLENWGEQQSYTLNDQTLTYKAFETTALKEDGGKNPLIIWLHGAGEGGTDVDIALLGNDVTNLGEDQIQSYFKTDTLKGAYVLAVQTPTFWMDNGEGGQGDGMKDSIYTEVLMETIEKYVTENGDIDENRIYLGGCSNGGYMTMNMALNNNYNDYFAAYYPVCEAKPDSSITDEDIALLKDSPIWFTAAANDTTVDPAKYTNATYARLMKAGASDVHYSLFEKVVGDDTGKEVEYMGHYSWIYTLKDECALDQADPNNIQAPSTKKVTYKGTEVNLWGWIAKHSK